MENFENSYAGCTSWSDVAWNTLKGCAGDVAADLTLARFVPAAAITPVVIAGSCAAGVAWT